MLEVSVKTNNMEPCIKCSILFTEKKTNCFNIS